MKDIVKDFRNAVIAGDREKAAVISAEINGALVRWLNIDEKAASYYDNSFIRLILAFAFVIALTSMAVFIMSKALARSIYSEAENRKTRRRRRSDCYHAYRKRQRFLHRHIGRRRRLYPAR